MVESQEEGGMKRKPRKPRPIERLMRSHKHLLESHRWLINEISQLRKYILEMRSMYMPVNPPVLEQIYFGRDLFTDGHGNDVSSLVNQ